MTYRPNMSSGSLNLTHSLTVTELAAHEEQTDRQTDRQTGSRKTRNAAYWDGRITNVYTRM